MVYLMRHGETQWNRDRIGFGRTDIPMSADGFRATMVCRIPDGIERIFTSPLTRAAETAAILAHRLNIAAPTISPALTERDHGTGEGIPKDARHLHGEPIGRETDEAIRERVTPFLRHLGPECLVVTHAGVILALNGQRAEHLGMTSW